MKKTVYIALLSASCLITNSVLAYNDYYDYERKFSGWLVGAETNVSKYDLKHYKNIDSKSGVGLNVVGAYGFEFGDSNLIGQIQERIGFGSASIKGGAEELKERFSSSLSYMQGYRIADVLMPYAKISFDLTYFDTNEVVISSGSAYGVGFGGGVKFAVSENLELGVEYNRMNLRGEDDLKFKGDHVALNLGYRF